MEIAVGRMHCCGMKHRHVRADKNEWVHVHRNTSSSGGSADWLGAVLGMAGPILMGLVWLAIIAMVISFLPYIIFGAMLLGALKLFAK